MALLSPFLSPSPRRLRLFVDSAAFAVILAAGAYALVGLAEGLGYNWQWYRLPRFLPSWEEGVFIPGPLLEGLGITLKITAASLVLSMVFGLGAALARLSNSVVLRGLSRGYLELIRNTPLLIQIFIVYFVLAPLVDMDRFWAGVLALSLFEGAYASEIIRAGILSLPAGQWEAAHSLGLSSRQTYSRIILPQAVRRVLPPLTSQAVSLVKDSSLVSVISVYELTLQGKLIVADTFLTFEVWFTVAAVYLFLNTVLSVAAQTLERRLKTP